MRWLWCLGVLLVALSSAGRAAAHGKSASYSRWELLPDGARVRLRLSKLDVSVLGLEHDGDLSRRVSQRLTMWSGDTRCQPSEMEPLVVSDVGWLAFEWRVSCPPENLRIDDQLLFDALPAHLHFAVVIEAGGEHEWVLSSGERGALVTHEVATAAPGSERFGALVLRFIPLGARHVGSGLDHLVFLLVLALGARSWRRLAWLVSGFTLGHAVSSSLSVLGFVATSTPAVEALIAASIAVVAVENVWLRGRLDDLRPPGLVLGGLALLALVSLALGKATGLALIGMVMLAGCYFVFLRRGGSADRARLGLTTGFGLVHGLGFATGMRELGLPEGRVVEALVGFNVGIELAQLGLLAAATVALMLARRASRRVDDLALTWGSAVALACACFWLLPRALA